MSQETCFKKIIDKCGITNLKFVFTPMAHHYKLNQQQFLKMVKEQSYMNVISYENIVGFRMYEIVCTCPKITFVVSVVSIFMLNLRQALKTSIIYLKGSLGRVLSFGGVWHKAKNSPIEVFVDFDCVGWLDTIKSLISYVFIVYNVVIGL